MRETKLLLVDDHAVVRQALVEFLSRVPGLSVVSAVGNADQAIREAIDHQPDIILLDIDLPGRSCFDAARTITARLSDVRLIFLSAFTHDRYIEQALSVGASGYVSKGQAPETLIAAIHAVAAGGTYFSDDVEQRLLVGTTQVTLTPQATSRLSALTAREFEILRQIALGLSQKEIAATVHLSPHTVQRHTNSIMHKLQIHSRVQLTRFAIREGVVQA